jgi:hypothetical protein
MAGRRRRRRVRIGKRRAQQLAANEGVAQVENWSLGASARRVWQVEGAVAVLGPTGQRRHRRDERTGASARKRLRRVQARA